VLIREWNKRDTDSGLQKDSDDLRLSPEQEEKKEGKLLPALFLKAKRGKRKDRTGGKTKDKI